MKISISIFNFLKVFLGTLFDFSYILDIHSTRNSINEYFLIISLAARNRHRTRTASIPLLELFIALLVYIISTCKDTALFPFSRSRRVFISPRMRAFYQSRGFPAYFRGPQKRSKKETEGSEKVERETLKFLFRGYSGISAD